MEATKILNELGTPCLIHQPKYSMFERWVEAKTPSGSLMDVLGNEGIGCIPFSPLAQGLLTNKYLKGIPEGSRAALSHGFLRESAITPEVVSKIQILNDLAEERGQTLAQMALAWLLKDERVTSVLIGASRTSQLLDSLECLNNKDFSNEELSKIEGILN